MADYGVSVWQERDRLHVHLWLGDENTTVLEWWDDDARQAVEDGFLNPADWKGSALVYAREYGYAPSEKEQAEFLAAYIECALWASLDENGEPLDDGRDDDDIAPETLAEMEADCFDFQCANLADLRLHGSPEQGGHDFWLTRNGHGAGFWDRGTGEVGDRLSEAARVYGGVDLYVGDDGMVYA